MNIFSLHFPNNSPNNFVDVLIKLAINWEEKLKAEIFLADVKRPSSSQFTLNFPYLLLFNYACYEQEIIDILSARIYWMW